MSRKAVQIVGKDSDKFFGIGSALIPDGTSRQLFEKPPTAVPEHDIPYRAYVSFDTANGHAVLSGYRKIDLRLNAAEPGRILHCKENGFRKVFIPQIVGHYTDRFKQPV